MAVRFNSDTDWISRTVNIGGAGHVNFALGGWFYLEEYNDSAGIVAAGHSSNGRTLGIACDNTFPTPLVSLGDSQTGITGSFSSQPPLNTWVYIEFSSPNTTGGTVTARWVELGSSTVNSVTRTNGVEASVQAEVVNVNRFQVGDANGFTGGLRAAYVRGYSGPTADDTAFLAHAADTTGTGTLFFWPLADNTDTSDASGNGNAPTFNGTLTSETSPTLGGGGGTIVEKTAEDGVGVSDQGLPSRLRGRVSSDGLQASDSGILSRERGAVATDTIVVTDASGFSREHQVSASDAFDLLDEASLSRMISRISNDGMNVLDEASWHRLLFRLADDAITIIDAITAATSGGTLHEIVATDAILMSDGTLKAVFLDRLAESQIELSDQAQQALQRLRELGDTLLIEDGSIRTVSRYRRLDTALEFWDDATGALNQHTTYSQDVRVLFGADPDGILFGSNESIVLGGYN